MPILIIEQAGGRVGGTITGRVLIGRLPTNGVVVTDSSVSRLHAWIDLGPDGNYFIADTGSLTGTWVNGRAIEKRKTLAHGDVLRIGETQMVFSMQEQLPEGVIAIDLAGSPPLTDTAEAGVLFECPCGAPVWFKAAAIGQSHQCRHCGRTIRIPATPGAIAQTISPAIVGEPGVPLGGAAVGLAGHEAQHEQSPLSALESPVAEMHPVDEHGLAEIAEDQTSPVRSSDASPTPAPSNGESNPLELRDEINAGLIRLRSLVQNPAPEGLPEPVPEPRTCSICHSAIAQGEATNICPSCGLSFHADCWQENRGCSAYGCSQVGVLGAVEVAKLMSGAAPPDEQQTVPPESTGFPWEYLFLGASVVGAVLGALVYGVPALIAAIGTAIYLAVFPESRKGRMVSILALLVCVLGTAAGLYTSYVYWNGWPAISPVAHRGGRP